MVRKSLTEFMQPFSLSSQDLSRFQLFSGRLVYRLIAALFALLPVGASAVSLGLPQLDSGLGQVLELAIPIRIDANEDFDSNCVRLVNPADDQLPALTVARIRVERDGVLLLARIQSLVPVNEPALRVVVEVGCTRRVQREYVLLIDPPALGGASAESDRQPVREPSEPERAPPALVFGEPLIRAIQGRRLLISVPLLGADAARLTPACLRLVNDGGQPPVFADARLRLGGAGSSRPVIEISSASALRDRMLRIVVEAGCDSAVLREFNVLVDAAPVPVDASLDDSKAANRAAARSTAGVRPGAALRAPSASASALPPPAAIAPPSPPPAKGPPSAAVADRLVLAMPEEAKAAPDARPSTVSDPSEELARRLDQLSSDVKRLRGELDSANQRNAVLSDKLAQDHGWGLGWWIAGVVSLAFAAFVVFTWRRRGGENEPLEASEGPLTRIIGKDMLGMPAPKSEHVGAVPASVLVGANLSEMRPHLHVTEMADEDAIRELYADVIRTNAMTVPLPRATPPDMPLDLLVGDTAISGSVEHDRDVGKDAGGQADSVSVGDDGTGTDGQAGRHDVDAEGGTRQKEPLAQSQFPTTLLKPLELDLDLSDFAQRNGKRSSD